MYYCLGRGTRRSQSRGNQHWLLVVGERKLLVQVERARRALCEGLGICIDSGRPDIYNVRYLESASSQSGRADLGGVGGPAPQHHGKCLAHMPDHILSCSSASAGVHGCNITAAPKSAEEMQTWDWVVGVTEAWASSDAIL
jgi:hypothetical protein